LAVALDKIRNGGVRRLSLVDPDAEFFLEQDVLANGAQSDVLAFRFQMEGVAGSKLQTVTEGLGQNDAAGLVEGELGDHVWHCGVGETNRQWQLRWAGWGESKICP